jgi:hypothetical protein
MAQKFKYTVRTRGGDRTHERDVVCEEHRIIEGIVYFLNKGNTWHYCCALSSLIDMESTGYVEPVKVEKPGQVEHIETVLPKEHSNV